MSICIGIIIFEQERDSIEDQLSTDLQSACDGVAANLAQKYHRLDIAQHSLASGMSVYSDDATEAQFRDYVASVKDWEFPMKRVVDISNDINFFMPLTAFFQRVFDDELDDFAQLLRAETGQPNLNITRRVQGRELPIQKAGQYMVNRFADSFALYGLESLQTRVSCLGDDHSEILRTGTRSVHIGPFVPIPSSLFIHFSDPVFFNGTRDFGRADKVSGAVTSLVDVNLMVDNVLREFDSDILHEMEMLGPLIPTGCHIRNDLIYQSSDFDRSVFRRSVSSFVTLHEDTYPLKCYTQILPGIAWTGWVILICCVVVGMICAFLVKVLFYRRSTFQALMDDRVAELRESKRKQQYLRMDMESILSAVWDPMLAFDNSGNIVSMNDAASRLSGHSISEFASLFATSLFELTPVHVDQGEVAANDADDNDSTHHMDTAFQTQEEVEMERLSGEYPSISPGMRSVSTYMNLGAPDLGDPSLSRGNIQVSGDPLGVRNEFGSFAHFASCLSSPSYEVHLKTKLGELIPVEVTVGRSTTKKYGTFVVIFRDIRKQRKHERLLLEAKETADRANKNKGDFVAFICHELRNPLHAIVGLSEMLVDSSLDHDQRDMVTSIAHSSKLMNTIVDDVLDLSKIEVNQLELEVAPFSLPELVRIVDDNSRLVSRLKVCACVGCVFMLYWAFCDFCCDRFLSFYDFFFLSLSLSLSLSSSFSLPHNTHFSHLLSPLRFPILSKYTERTMGAQKRRTTFHLVR